MGAGIQVKVGCCGFPIARSKYYKKFKVVEVQKTFYKPPRSSTLGKWREEAPKDFEFTVKAWMVFTHDPRSPIWRKTGMPRDDDYGLLRPTEKNMKEWNNFTEIIKPLEPKFIVFQSPPSFKATKENIRNVLDFFNSIERETPLGWEVRDESWKPHIVRVMQEVNLIHVVDPLYEEPLYGEMIYFRLHGGRKGSKIMYNYRYSDEELIKVKQLLDELGKVGYVMFNNGVYMVEDGIRFLEILHR